MKSGSITQLISIKGHLKARAERLRVPHVSVSNCKGAISPHINYIRRFFLLFFKSSAAKGLLLLLGYTLSAVNRLCTGKLHVTTSSNCVQDFKNTVITDKTFLSFGHSATVELSDSEVDIESSSAQS